MKANTTAWENNMKQNKTPLQEGQSAEGATMCGLLYLLEDSEKHRTDFKGLRMSTSKTLKGFWKQFLLFSGFMALMIEDSLHGEVA